MDRCLSSEKGFTLLEMIMALALGAIVLLSASDLFINFMKFSSNMIKAESSLMDTTLGVYEEIIYNISRANLTALGNETAIATPNTPFPGGCSSTSCIQVRADTDAGIKTPSDYSDDIVYTYYLNTGTVYRAIGGAAGVVIARNVTTLTFSRPGSTQNAILVVLEGQVQSGVTGGFMKEHMETTVIARARSI